MERKNDQPIGWWQGVLRIARESLRAGFGTVLWVSRRAYRHNGRRNWRLAHSASQRIVVSNGQSLENRRPSDL